MSDTSSTTKVRNKAHELLVAAPAGIRYMDLHRTIAAIYPDIPKNTVHGALHKFRSNLPVDIEVVTKGLYRHIKFTQAQEVAAEEKARKPKIREEDFYQPFADWLENELEECTKAIALGGARFGNKWGTPDVVGVRVASRDDLIKFQEEVTSAEIKIDTQGTSPRLVRPAPTSSFPIAATSSSRRPVRRKTETGSPRLLRYSALASCSSMPTASINPSSTSKSAPRAMSRTTSTSIRTYGW